MDRLLKERMDNVFNLTVEMLSLEVSEMLMIADKYLQTLDSLKDWNYAIPKAIMYVVMEELYKKFSPSKGDEWFYEVLQMRRDTKPKNKIF